MKKIKIIFTFALAIIGINQLSAQDTSISKSLGLYVFPSNNQDAKTQETD